MPKILYINPLGTDAFDERFKRILESAARPETEIQVISFKPIDENLINVSLYLGETFRAVVKAEKNGFDAVIIGCCVDPGLSESKNEVKIPVVGPAEASLHVASMLGPFSAIIAEPDTYMQELARKYGLAHMLASVKSANAIRPADENEIAIEDPKRHRQIIMGIFQKAMVATVPELARSAVIEDQARAIILGCTLFSGWAKERKVISKELKVPVMDPAIVSLKVAEMHIDNLSKS